MSLPPLLTVRDLACRRGDRLLFSGLDLDVAAGGALVVEGPNGAGKTSLLRVLAGLLRPFAGHVERPAGIAYMGPELALDLDRPLAGALDFWARLDGADGGAMAAALTAMDLGRLTDVPVRFLSSGQRRRAALVRIIAGGARLWLLDEPGIGLDAASLDRLAGAMARHRADGGAIIATSHMPLGLIEPARLRLDGQGAEAA